MIEMYSPVMGMGLERAFNKNRHSIAEQADGPPDLARNEHETDCSVLAKLTSSM
jgi:hypothetical protein